MALLLNNGCGQDGRTSATPDSLCSGVIWACFLRRCDHVYFLVVPLSLTGELCFRRAQDVVGDSRVEVVGLEQAVKPYVVGTVDGSAA